MGVRDLNITKEGYMLVPTLTHSALYPKARVKLGDKLIMMLTRDKSRPAIIIVVKATRGGQVISRVTRTHRDNADSTGTTRQALGELDFHAP